MSRTLVATLSLLALAAAAAAQDRPAPAPAPTAPAAPAGEEKAPPAKPGPDLVPWTHDYGAAKEQAAKEKKGVLVYLTPAWFT